MQNKIILQILRNISLLILGYIKSTCGKRLKKAFLAAKDEFIRTFWNDIREDIQNQVELTCSQIQEYMQSASMQEKKKMVFEAVFQKIKFPFFLKPFKYFIKKSLEEKLESTIQDILTRAPKLI